MNDLQIFVYSGEQLRTIQRPDGLWWVLRDVCQVLGLSNPTVVASLLEDDERTKFNLGRQGEAIIINEPGLYAVILRSDKPEAKSFKRWVTHEVLPSIRRTGGYTVPASQSRKIQHLQSLQKSLKEFRELEEQFAAYATEYRKRYEDNRTHRDTCHAEAAKLERQIDACIASLAIEAVNL